MQDYKMFLKQKQRYINDHGFDISFNDINPILFEFQKYTVQKALKFGKFAIFADTGLGKTFMQLEIANQIVKQNKGKVLILAPLAVSSQTIEQASILGMDIGKSNKHQIQITNYEQVNNIHAEDYCAIILDESSILKNATGKYRNLLIDKFKSTNFKFCFSATPSPNDPMELGNHSEFLDVMSYNEMLAMYFVHDGGQTQKWRLKKHAISKFYEFVSTWAIMYSHPNDIGYNTNGFDLPKLEIIEKQVKTPPNKGELFSEKAINATDYNKGLRETESERIQQTVKIVQSIAKNESIIIWTKQNEEAKNIYNQLQKIGYNCRNVQGSDSAEKKEFDLLGFAYGEYQILITKQSIASQGMNYQNCAYQIFNSVDFSFEQSYQAMRRSWRFGQKRKVTCFMVSIDKMSNIIKIQKEKQIQFKKMQNEMIKAMNKIVKKEVDNSNSPLNEVEKTPKYTLYKGDVIDRIKEIKNNEIDLTIFSPPFSELYVYSSYIEDMGNSKNYKEFENHFKFLIPEIKRIMKPGRICAVHCMDLPIQKGKEGYIGLRDFSGMLVKWFQDKGFIYHSRITIWKNPVTEMQRTKSIGLLHRQLKKDSVMSRVGIPDYILLFRNEGENEIPIANENIPVSMWQKIASPIWYDIDYGRTLNYRTAKSNEDEKHICPLQLDTIERLIQLYSNENEIVFDPFGGIGSTGYQALKMNRKSISIELKGSYFETNKLNHKAAINESTIPNFNFEL